MKSMRLEAATSRSRVKHSTTEPLRSLVLRLALMNCSIDCINEEFNRAINHILLN